MTLKLRLLLAFIAIVVFTVGVLSSVSIQMAVSQSDTALTNSVEKRLISQNVQTLRLLPTILKL
ncbi:MAG: hypothetical protein GW763_05735 [Paraglaciecola sp.]|nr:hypothetical protein [Paraglaciecola sp.]NCT47483.1 hypothetical protein [Paraglaciecola sp.]